jgi:transcription elongation factor GreB
MNKAFTKESDAHDNDDALEAAAPTLPPGSQNYMTPAGYRRLRDELQHLLNVARPEVVRTVSWAASNGDRSENADYIYGKRRLREIDRRIRFLTRRLEAAEVVDSRRSDEEDRVFFGATVSYAMPDGVEQTVTIVGVDEVNLDIGHVSWVSPIARALIKARSGDSVPLHTPTGIVLIEILDVSYPARE